VDGQQSEGCDGLEAGIGEVNRPAGTGGDAWRLQDQRIEVSVGNHRHGVPTETSGELRHGPMLPEQHDSPCVRVKGLATSKDTPLW